MQCFGCQCLIRLGNFIFDHLKKIVWATAFLRQRSHASKYLKMTFSVLVTLLVRQFVS